MSSAPVLTFLAADRVVPADTVFTSGTVLPCSEVEVQSTALAATLLAVALWDLREQNRVTLAVEERKRLGLIRTNPVMVRPVPAGGAADTPSAPARAATLQDELLAAVTSPKGHRVKDLVWEWFREDAPSPNAVVIDRVVADALAEGLYEEVDSGHGKVGRFFLGATELRPRCDAIESHRAEADGVLARWQGFVQTEADLAALLLKECEKGIGSRTEAADD